MDFVKLNHIANAPSAEEFNALIDAFNALTDVVSIVAGDSMAYVVRTAALRRNADPRITHTKDDRQAKPV